MSFFINLENDAIDTAFVSDRFSVATGEGLELLALSGGELQLENSTALRITTNNHPFLRQKNAAGSRSPALVFLDRQDSLVLGDGFVANMRWAGTGLFAFGSGLFSGFPALKANGATLAVRTATDSADAPLSASIVTATNRFIGNVSGNVTGNVTGNLTGNVTGSATSLLADGVNLYRFAAASLKTDSTLLVGGNLGIGTTRPRGKVEVTAPGQNVTYLTGTGPSGQAILLFDTPDVPNSHTWDIRSAGNSLLFRDDTAGVYRLSIGNDGNVGIGTTSPSQRLDVNGSINVAGNFMGVGLATDPTPPSKGGWKLYAKDDGTEKMQLCVLFSTGPPQCFARQP
jgi:hypothetical protein